jgi:ribosome maturation factor RimP
MLDKQKIENLVEAHFENSDFFLVEVAISTQDKITIYFDRMEGRVTISDCVKLSKFIEANLNREEHDFELEVSSAGLDEPFKVFKQYQKHIGKEVKIIDISGKRTNGILIEATPERIVLELSKKINEEGRKKKITVTEKIEIPFQNIKQTKRIIKF